MNEATHTAIDGIVGFDILRADYEDVLLKVAALNDGEKAQLLEISRSAIAGIQSRLEVDVRVSAVRAIVALLPLSLDYITELLKKFSGKQDFETHYTLFCYLDWTQRMPNAPGLKHSVLPLLEGYLMMVPRATAWAAWMAFDLLGCHWEMSEALPILLRTARQARYATGRSAAVSGLEDVLAGLPPQSEYRDEILDVLWQVFLHDRVPAVRREAETIWQIASHLKS